MATTQNTYPAEIDLPIETVESLRTALHAPHARIYLKQGSDTKYPHYWVAFDYSEDEKAKPGELFAPHIQTAHSRIAARLNEQDYISEIGFKFSTSDVESLLYLLSGKVINPFYLPGKAPSSYAQSERSHFATTIDWSFGAVKVIFDSNNNPKSFSYFLPREKRHQEVQNASLEQFVQDVVSYFSSRIETATQAVADLPYLTERNVKRDIYTFSSFPEMTLSYALGATREQRIAAGTPGVDLTDVNAQQVNPNKDQSIQP